MANHYRKTIKKYRKRKSAACPFCKPETIANAIYENKDIYIVPNLTQYDLWEHFDVEDHLLIIPRHHAKALADLSQKERLAIMEAATEYEAKGYSVYARGKGFIQRSVEHQHTHLIKTVNKRPRFIFYVRKPYFLIKF